MDHLVAAIRQSVASECWYGALALALSAPSVCGFVSTGRDIKEQYEAWFDDNVGHLYRIKTQGPASPEELAWDAEYAGDILPALIWVQTILRFSQAEDVCLLGKLLKFSELRVAMCINYVAHSYMKGLTILQAEKRPLWTISSSLLQVEASSSTQTL